MEEDVFERKRRKKPMSLRPDPIGPVPEETVRVARTVFRKGNLCLRLRETLGTIYEDELFADLFSPTGRPAEAPWRLALVCVLQYVEDLSDRQAAEAVRARIDWKYLLGLELTDVGFDFSVLSEFRDRLLKQKAGPRIFERLVERLSEGGWIKKRGVQRTDSTHVLAAVRRLNRVELLGEMLRAALNSLAEHDPDWLTGWVPLEWFERYSRRIEEWRLPSAKDKQEAVMEQIGQDGLRLLSELWSDQPLSSLRALPEVEGLRKMWTQQFFWQEGVLHLRNKDDLPPAHLTLRSPYDHQAHYGHKRDLAWFGYKVHFSETCDDELPHLITHVETTDATKTDMEQTEAIHQALSVRGLEPGEHVLDAGYVDAETILQSRERHGIEVIGPVSQNNQWQAKKGGYDASQFAIDWQAQVAVCPQGKTSVKWTPGTDQYGHPNVSIRFGLHDCRACACRSLCTRSVTNPRLLTIRQQAEYEILQQARLRQQTDEFRVRYAQRSGIEGTHSQAVRALGLRRTRYFGLPKTALSHVFTAAAINLIRLDAFLEGRKAAKTRVSRFAALAPVDLAS
jgi:transposase